MEQPAKFKFPLRVFYEDTDAGGIVYHANYIKYFERARTEWLRELGINHQALLAQDIAFAVRSAQVDYLLPAQLDQQLTVKCAISELRRATVMFSQLISNEQGQVLCTGKFKVACINMKTHKPVRIPSHITEVFEIVA